MTGEEGRLRAKLVKRDSAGRTGKEPVGFKAFRVDIEYRILRDCFLSTRGGEEERGKICVQD